MNDQWTPWVKVQVFPSPNQLQPTSDSCYLLVCRCAKKKKKKKKKKEKQKKKKKKKQGKRGKKL